MFYSTETTVSMIITANCKYDSHVNACLMSLCSKNTASDSVSVFGTSENPPMIDCPAFAIVHGASHHQIRVE